MKSTILQIIVKQWFRDKAGIEIDDSVLDKVIQELTEQPGIFKSTHYESKKDAEAKEDNHELIECTVESIGKHKTEENIEFIELKYDYGDYKLETVNKGDKIYLSLIRDQEYKEESDWISAKDKMPPLHIEGNLPIVQILGHDNVTMEGYHCYMIGVWMTTNNKIVEVTHWKYKNN